MLPAHQLQGELALNPKGIRGYEGLGWGCSHEIFQTAKNEMIRRNGRLSAIFAFHCAHGAIIPAAFPSCAQQCLACDDACKCHTSHGRSLFLL